MRNVDILQNNRINLAIALLTGVSAMVGVMVYLERKKHNQIQSEIFALEKRIKELQLHELKNGKKSIG
jgi:pyruvate/2-oxoglutarate dehydrogenase complex dihydrolipoamide acyltransferase (E2) component